MPTSLLLTPILKKIGTVRQILNGVRAAFAYLEARGLEREKIISLLDLAESENRDLTDAEVAGAIGKAQEAVDRLREAAQTEPSLGELQQKAESLGIEVDGRWGVERLKEEIAAAEAGPQDE